MLAEANLLESFWPYMLSTYCHVHNCCLTSALPHNLTPYKAFKGQKPRVGHLQVFSCVAFVLIGQNKQKGLSGRIMSGIFIGYP